MDARAFNLIINDGRRPGHIKSLFIMARACEINKPADKPESRAGQYFGQNHNTAAKFVA